MYIENKNFKLKGERNSEKFKFVIIKLNIVICMYIYGKLKID